MRQNHRDSIRRLVKPLWEDTSEDPCMDCIKRGVFKVETAGSILETHPIMDELYALPLVKNKSGL